MRFNPGAVDKLHPERNLMRSCGNRGEGDKGTRMTINSNAEWQVQRC